jgi:nicotinic acid mononucleotide adenylyltransferase
MKTYKQFLKEASNKTLVLAFGRMQPPHKGHSKLAEAVKSVAKSNAATYEVWISATQDAKKNPLPVSRKVFWAKKMFNEGNIHAAGGNVKTPIDLLKSKSGKFENIIFVVGSDRVETFQKLFDTYNGKDYNFSSIEVVSAGERDPDADDISGMSATKMRQAALNNDHKLFHSGTVGLSDEESAELMREVRTGLKVKNVSESLVGVSAIRNSFYLNERFRIGEYISDGKNVFEILDRGANYVMAVNESGDLSRHFIENVSVVEDANIPQHQADGKFSFKGFKPGAAFQSNEQAVAAFADTVERYEDGRIKDSVAILKALKSVDAFLSLTHSIIVDQNHPDDEKVNLEMLKHFDSAKSSLSRIGEFAHHMDYMDTLKDMVGVSEIGEPEMNEEIKFKTADKLKVASIIADTLGVETSGSNPENIVNVTLRKAKQNPQMMRGDALKILTRMLELAKEVDIKYDENILKDKIKPAVAESTQPLQEGAKVAIKHESGKVTYGKIKGTHGSVVEVSHRNGKVGFYHNHRIEQVEDGAEDAEVTHLGKRSEASPEQHTATGHGMTFSDHSHRKMKVNYQKGE